jgi:hypothetical protein
MDTRLTGTLGFWCLFIAAIFAVALAMTLAATPSSAAGTATCSVTNADSGRAFPRLQQAVDAAKPGAQLVVKGTCIGGIFIDRDLVIVGQRTKRLGKPILDSDGRDRVLKVRRGVRVAMSDLTLQDGRTDRRGGGIVNRGTLRLTRVVVRDNRSQSDGGGIWNVGTLWLTDSRVRENETGDFVGGIYNDHGTVILNGDSGINANLGQGVSNWGTLTMNDASTIRNNRFTSYGSPYGGGVDNSGVMTMNDSSSISGHRAVWGGGVFIGQHGTLTMNDASVISGNRVTNRVGYGNPYGGGVAGGRLVMNDASAIRGNSSAWLGGGLDAGSTRFLTGVTCGPGGNVYGNTPDDCYFEP